MYILKSNSELQLNTALPEVGRVHPSSLNSMDLLCMYCDIWKLGPLQVCADHTPNTLLSALRFYFYIYIFINILK